MSQFKEYASYDAVGLAELIKTGQVSASEVCEAAIAQIDALNPQLNAVIHTQFADARRRAKKLEPDSVMGGVPFLLKDLMGEQAGEPCTLSCSALADWTASHDAELVKRFKHMGLNILGRTNAPEFGIYAVTESTFRGPCRNPWNLDHTPGGSSGGSAAAVAARMVPIAHAGDGGGSIRIPAAHCGLVGLKPSRGRLPLGPDRGERWGGFVAEGVVTRSVRDSAFALHYLEGADLGAPYAAPHHPADFLDQVRRAPRKLKIGLCEMALFGESLHEDNLAAVHHTAKHLEQLGHEVEIGCPVFDREALIRAYFVTVASGVNQGVRQIERKIGRSLREEDLELSTWALKLIGDSVSAGEYLDHQNTIHFESRRVARFFEAFDVLLLPTAAQPPVEIGHFELSGFQRQQIRLLKRMPLRKLLDLALDSLATNALNATPNTMLFNQTGQPAVSVPMFINDKQLPIGSQLVGRFGDELTLLQLAGQLEEADPWAHRMPACVKSL
ncbi:MAG: amidase [Bradymonadia bacterium]